MKPTRLARLIDIAEKREIFNSQVTGTTSRLRIAMEKVLALPDAPRTPGRTIAAVDALAIIRALIDAAGERGEGESNDLLLRTEGAVCGYLQRSASAATARPSAVDASTASA